MITINLLPSQKKKRRTGLDANWLNKAATVFVATILIVASLAVAFFYRSQLSQAKTEVRTLEDRKDSLADEVAEVDRMQAELNKLDQRAEVIEELVYSGPEWARKLNQISDLVPRKIWMERLRVETEISTRTEREGNRTRQVRVRRTFLYLTGVTQDVANGLTLVAELKSRLENSPFMEDFKGEIVPTQQAVEPWLERSRSASGLRSVWRFTLSMEVDREARKAEARRERRHQQPARTVAQLETQVRNARERE